MGGEKKTADAKMMLETNAAEEKKAAEGQKLADVKMAEIKKASDGKAAYETKVADVEAAKEKKVGDLKTTEVKKVAEEKKVVDTMTAQKQKTSIVRVAEERKAANLKAQKEQLQEKEFARLQEKKSTSSLTPPQPSSASQSEQASSLNGDVLFNYKDKKTNELGNILGSKPKSDAAPVEMKAAAGYTG